jgi:hypothetical protein
VQKNDEKAKKNFIYTSEIWSEKKRSIQEGNPEKKRRKGLTEESQTAVHGIDLMDQIMCISIAGLYGSLCYAGGINIWAKRTSLSARGRTS